MRCVMSYIELFGSKTVFETWQAVKNQIFPVKNSHKISNLKGWAKIRKNVIRKISVSKSNQSKKVLNSFPKSSGHLLRPPPPPPHLRRYSVFALTHFINFPPPLTHAKWLYGKTGILMQHRWAWITPWTSTWTKGRVCGPAVYFVLTHGDLQRRE